MVNAISLMLEVQVWSLSQSFAITFPPPPPHPPPPPPPPRRKKLGPLENVGPLLDPWKCIVSAVIKPLDPLCKLYIKLRTKKRRKKRPDCFLAVSPGPPPPPPPPMLYPSIIWLRHHKVCHMMGNFTDNAQIQKVLSDGVHLWHCFFSHFFFVDEGRKNDPNSTKSRPSSTHQQNTINMAFRWRANGGPTLYAASVALWLISIDKESYSPPPHPPPPLWFRECSKNKNHWNNSESEILQ